MKRTKEIAIMCIVILLGTSMAWAVVSGQTTKVSFTCNGSTTSFACTGSNKIPCFANTDMKVYVRNDTTGVETLQVLTTNYTVAAFNNDYTNGFTVTMSSAPASGQTLVVKRSIALTQEVNLVRGRAIPQEGLERTLDRQMLALQDSREELGRALRFQVTDSSYDANLPSSVDRANKYLAFGASGDPTVTGGTTSDIVVSSWAETLVDDATAAAARTTLGITTSNLIGIINVQDPPYNATGAGAATDDTTAIQAAFDAANADGGSIILFPYTSNYYKLTDELTLYSNFHIIGIGKPQIRQTVSGKKIFTGSSISNIVIDNLHLKGRGAVTSVTTGEDIIRIDSGSQIILSNLFIEEVRGHYGICFNDGTNILVDRCTIDEFTYAGIAFLGDCENVWAVKNVVKDCVGTGANSYGITHGDEATPHDFGKNIYYLFNQVENIKRWEGLDIHGGENIYIIGNTVKDCRAGIAVGVTYSSGGDNFCKNVHIIDNNIEVATDAAGSGQNMAINLVGALDTGTYYYVENATIRGNTCRYGNQVLESNNSGGILVYIVKNVNIDNNYCYRNYLAGIMLYHRVKQFTIKGNICVDNYGTFGSGIYLRADGIENGIIEGNVFYYSSDDPNYTQEYGIAADAATTSVYDRDNLFSVNTASYYNPAYFAYDSREIVDIVDVNNAELEALNATPLELVAAPGSNNVLEFVSAILVLDYSGAGLTESSDNLAIEYDDGGDVAVSETIEMTGFIDQTADMVTRAVPIKDAIDASADIVNKNLALVNTGNGEFGNGGSATSELRVIITYRIHRSLGL
jgi:parallel beta-helix repeat protein